MIESLPDPSPASNPHKDYISRIRLIEGDITQQNDVDAIVTSMPTTLSIRSDLNRSIIEAAGERLDDFVVENIFRPRAGDVHPLPGFNLPVKHILVAITPIWRRGDDPEDRDLMRCYRAIMETAWRMSLETLAVPAIGTGRGVYPVARAARLSLNAILDRYPPTLRELRIVCMKKEVLAAFRQRLSVLAENAGVKLAE